MWSVVMDSGEYVVQDHNGDEQARLAADGGVSTSDVKQVMHDRCTALREDIQRGGGSSPIAIDKIMEYFAVLEDMAGENIELPSGET
jgi:hypothetical protein